MGNFAKQVEKQQQNIDELNTARALSPANDFFPELTLASACFPELPFSSSEAQPVAEQRYCFLPKHRYDDLKTVIHN